MSDEATNTTPFQGQATGGVVDTAAVAAEHPISDVPRTRKPRSDKGRSRGSKAGLADNTGTDQASGGQTSVGGGVALSPETRNQVITAIRSLITVVDDRCCQLIRRTAERITQDKSFADQLAQDNRMSETERESISTLTVVVVEKYNLLGTYAPEAMLGLAIIGYGYRVQSTLSDLRKLAAEQAATIKQNGLPTQATPIVDNGEKRNG